MFLLFLICPCCLPCTISHRIHKRHTHTPCPQLQKYQLVALNWTHIHTYTYAYTYTYTHTHTSTHIHTPQKSGRCVDSLLTFWNPSSRTQGPSRHSSEQGSMFDWSHLRSTFISPEQSNKKTGYSSPTSHKDLCFHKRGKPGLPWWSGGQGSTCQCRGHVFNLRSGKIPMLGCKQTRVQQLLSPNSRALEPQLSLRAAAEACALQREKPPQWEAHAPQWRVTPSHCN